MATPLTDTELAEWRARTGMWPSNSEECERISATIDHLTAEVTRLTELVYDIECGYDSNE